MTRTFLPFAALAVVVLATDGLTAQSWSQRNPLNAPGPRRAGAMAFDVASNRVLINGGTIAHPAQIVAETWVYNGSSWTQLNVTTPARWGHQLVRDTLVGRLITFGGRSPTINGLAHDTWAWTGSAWQQLTPVHAPPARYRYGMAYDDLRERVVLFGGRAAPGNMDDTWEFDGLDWTQVNTATRPQPREDMVMVFDSDIGTTVLFGGYDNDTATMLGDTWEYRGTDWRETTPAASPTPRYRCAGVYDTTRRRVVVYGGYDGATFRRDTYEYTGAEWLLVLGAAGPTNATEMYFAFDPSRNKTVTYGGVGTVFSDETWEFTGASTAFFGPYGTGCPHGNGLSTITGNAPVLGSALSMEIQDVPPTTLACIVAQGFSATSASIGVLPFDLSPFGLIDCFLEARDDAVVAVLPDTNGDFIYGFTVPNSTALLNLSYFTQAFVPHAVAPNGIGGMSRPSRGVFGN